MRTFKSLLTDVLCVTHLENWVFWGLKKLLFFLKLGIVEIVENTPSTSPDVEE